MTRIAQQQLGRGSTAVERCVADVCLDRAMRPHWASGTWYVEGRNSFDARSMHDDVFEDELAFAARTTRREGTDLPVRRVRAAPTRSSDLGCLKGSRRACPGKTDTGCILLSPILTTSPAAIAVAPAPASSLVALARRKTEGSSRNAKRQAIFGIGRREQAPECTGSRPPLLYLKAYPMYAVPWSFWFPTWH
jgi:hypothetical protein